MNPMSQSTRRGLSLRHIFLFAIVLVDVIVITAALADRRYLLAAVALAVVAVGLPVAARMRKLRASLSGDDDRARRL